MNTYIVAMKDNEKLDPMKMKLIAHGFKILTSSVKFGIIVIEDPVNVANELVIKEVMGIPGVRSIRKEMNYESLIDEGNQNETENS